MPRGWIRDCEMTIKNVIIELCDIEANFGAPLSDPSNAGFQRTIAGWQALTSGPGSGSGRGEEARVAVEGVDPTKWSNMRGEVFWRVFWASLANI